MGGVKVNSWGESTIPGLFAVGETACTGVHGANRLASNSLLESVVFSKRLVQRTEGVSSPDSCQPSATSNLYSLPEREPSSSTPPLNLPNLQSLMWDRVGIVRSGESLKQAASILAAWRTGLPQPSDRPSYELNNLILSARLMTEAALLRQESRGAHFRTDFPQTLSEWQRHIVFGKDAVNQSPD
jgi:L-aspartate oxidase